MDYFENSNEQSRESIDAKQMFEAFEDAKTRADQYKGSMAWKTVSGKDYLYRKYDSYGDWKSLGPKSEDTQAKYKAFIEGKEEAKERLSSIKAHLDVRAKFAKAARINRVPLIVAKITRELDRSGLLDSISIVGTNAIYAYEEMAACRVSSGLMATSDVDFLWDSRSKISLASKGKLTGFLDLIKKADKSFERTKALYRAVNKDGFMVDLIKAEPKDVIRSIEREQMGDHYDLKASGIGSLRWLINSPKVETVAIDQQGYPFRMSVPDPRCFAIHKLWLSEQPTRRAEKAMRDRAQAIAVAEIIIDRLPQFRFKMEELKMFPKAIAEKGLNEISRLNQLRP